MCVEDGVPVGRVQLADVPAARLRAVNAAPLRPAADWVVYWMIACRRPDWNFGLQRAVALARETGRPLIVLEALRSGYRWASDRIHRFVIDGMRDNARRFAGTNVRYYPYIEPRPGAGRGLLPALGRRAVAVVTDDFPAFFLPRMVEAAGRKLGCRLEAVDSNGLLPVRATDRVFGRAHAFRRYLQGALPEHLAEFPQEHPLRGAPLPPIPAAPPEIAGRWPPAAAAELEGTRLSTLPIDHTVPAVPYAGGHIAARQRLKQFLDERLARYEEGNDPGAEATSGLSPYLHFGHISPHEVFRALAAREGWSPDHLPPKPTGSRAGWWGMRPPAEAFLDELVTWREVGFNMAALAEEYTSWESVPGWARETLEEHAADPREYVYDREAFEGAASHDRIWNAAQRQLREEGVIHGSLRMLWGKKILHWSAGPRDALDIMVDLNNRWAIDGRDPNSWSGIHWCLGRYDRPWGPERAIFGKVRYMSSENARRKHNLAAYLDRWS